MSTSTVDLSSLNSVDFGGGITGFQDPSTGQVYDSQGNPLSSSDLTSYGAYTVTGSIGMGGGSTSSQSTFHAPAPTATANSTSQGGQGMSGLTGLFTSVGSAFGTLVNPPKNTPGGQQLVYSAATGGYVPASQAVSGGLAGTASSMAMWLVIGVVAIAAVFILRKG